MDEQIRALEVAARRGDRAALGPYLAELMRAGVSPQTPAFEAALLQIVQDGQHPPAHWAEGLLSLLSVSWQARQIPTAQGTIEELQFEHDGLSCALRPLAAGRLEAFDAETDQEVSYERPSPGLLLQLLVEGRARFARDMDPSPADRIAFMDECRGHCRPLDLELVQVEAGHWQAFAQPLLALNADFPDQGPLSPGLHWLRLGTRLAAPIASGGSPFVLDDPVPPVFTPLELSRCLAARRRLFQEPVADVEAWGERLEGMVGLVGGSSYQLGELVLEAAGRHCAGLARPRPSGRFFAHPSHPENYVELAVHDGRWEARACRCLLAVHTLEGVDRWWDGPFPVRVTPWQATLSGLLRELEALLDGEETPRIVAPADLSSWVKTPESDAPEQARLWAAGELRDRFDT